MTGQEIMAAVLRSASHNFVGRLARAPELKTFDSGNCVAKGRIAINKAGAKKDDGSKPDWFTVEIWGAHGIAFSDQCAQGDLVAVAGRVKTNRWKTQDGEDRTDLIICAEQFRNVTQNPEPSPTPKPLTPVDVAAKAVADTFAGEVTATEADIPF